MQLNFFTGTAAELIKLYPVIHFARERGHTVRVISSGQSRENFRMQYRDLQLPESDLATLLASDGDLDKASSALRWFLRAIFTSRRVFREKLLHGRDAFLIVHGDTLSTLAGAWLGRRAGLPVVHIEAGLRSKKLFNPFPEEITRRLVSRLAKYHMAPDAAAEKNLRASLVRGKIVNTCGNTLLDAVRLSASLTNRKYSGASFALANLHRFENLNSISRWRIMVETVVKAAAKIKVVFITHPQTRFKLEQDKESMNLFLQAKVEIRERLPFSEFISLLKASEFLISDGGSNQEECSYLGKPCLLLRESTERSEGLETCCVLSRFDEETIRRFLANPSRVAYSPSGGGISPSNKIIDALEAAVTRTSLLR